MTLTLHLHPLASFCWKALIAFYENETPFDPVVVDLGDETSRAEFLRLSPIGKMPVLQDAARDRIVPESTIVIEYLAQYYPGAAELIPADPELAWRARLSDRFYDFYVHEPMQKIVLDRLRPAGRSDPHGVELARQQIRASYALIEADMAAKSWAIGDRFTLADCAAVPALFYADKVEPFGDTHGNIAGYFARLMERHSVARVLREAQPYFDLFPVKDA